MKKYYLFFFYVFIFIFLFSIIHVIHLNFFFYIHIAPLIVIDILLAIILGYVILLNKKPISYFSLFVSALTASLISLMYGIVLPIMVDRSLTVDMFLQMYNSKNNSIKIDKLKELVLENGMNIRLSEQLNSGLIVIKNDEIQLTNKGLRIAKLFYFNNRILKIRSLRKNL